MFGLGYVYVLMLKIQVTKQLIRDSWEVFTLNQFKVSRVKWQCILCKQAICFFCAIEQTITKIHISTELKKNLKIFVTCFNFLEVKLMCDLQLEHFYWMSMFKLVSLRFLHLNECQVKERERDIALKCTFASKRIVIHKRISKHFFTS